jgi:hypothetical protein
VAVKLGLSSTSAKLTDTLQPATPWLFVVEEQEPQAELKLTV